MSEATLRLRCEIPKPFKPLIDPNVREIVERSGRSSGKTTTNENVAALTALQGGNVWYACANEGDIEKTIRASFASTISAMGVEKYFSYFASQKTYKCVTGGGVYFGGINGKTVEDTTRTKGFTPKNKRLDLAICDEANKANSPLHLDGFKTTADKFLTPTAKVVWAFNPHPNKTHWSHKYFADRIRGGATELYSTYKDIVKLLKPATLAEIAKAKEIAPLFYRYWYLGECVNFSGMVYPQFNRAVHAINILSLIATGDKITQLIIGVDEGTVKDSTSCCPLAIMASGKAVVLDTFENVPSREGQDSTPTQSRKIIAWFNDLLMRFRGLGLGTVPRIWNFECAEGGQALMRQFREDSGEPCVTVKNKSVWGDIKRVRAMLSENILFFHVGEGSHTDIVMTDIEGYIIDPNTNDIKDGQREDTIDALEYATKLYYDRPVKTYF